MNILYLHGLSSSGLGPEKRNILEKYGKVFSPAIDYRTESNSIELLAEQYRNQNIQAVIGSSMGGFIAYYLADAFKIPSLLFNPALASRPVNQRIPIFRNPYLSLKQIVLAANDEVINPKDTLVFLSKTLQQHTDYHIHIRQDIKHQIPINVFEEEVKMFFEKI